MGKSIRQTSSKAKTSLIGSAHAVRVLAPAQDINSLDYSFVAVRDNLRLAEHECSIEVAYAGLNNSDVSAVLGKIPGAIWPRVPGRDYAGTVLRGPAAWIGKTVWGGGGDLGLMRDGSCSRFIKVSSDSLFELPAGMPAAQAASIASPLAVAYNALCELANIQAGESVLILGAYTRVGQLCMQLAAALGVRAYGVVTQSTFQATIQSSVQTTGSADRTNIINACGASLQATKQKLQELSQQATLPVIINCVAEVYLPLARELLAADGRYVVLTTSDNLQAGVLSYADLQQYHWQIYTLNTTALGHIASANCLQKALSKMPVIKPLRRSSERDLTDFAASVAEYATGQCPTIVFKL